MADVAELVMRDRRGKRAACRRVIVVALAAAASASAQPLPCRPDGRLLPALRAALDRETPDAARLLTMTEGASMRAPEVLVWRAEGGTQALRAARLRAWITGRSDPGVTPRCAVVWGREVTAAALVPRLAEVLDEPRDAARRRWRVALPSGATRAELVIAPDHGPVTRTPIDPDGRVQAAGVEAATAQVVVWRGVEPRVWARWRVGARSLDASDPVARPAELMARANALRAAQGTPSLRADPLLARVAAERAAEAANAGAVSHILGGADPVLALSRRGVRADRVAEVIGRAPSLGGAYEALVASPSHVERLLDGLVDAVGIGVGRSGGQVYLVMILATRPRLGGE